MSMEIERNPRKQTDSDVKIKVEPFTERPQQHIITAFNDLAIPLETPILIHDKKCIVIESSEYENMKQRTDALLNSLNDMKKRNDKLLNSLNVMNRSNSINYSSYIDVQRKYQQLVDLLKFHNIEPRMYDCRPLDFTSFKRSTQARQLPSNDSKKEEFSKPMLRKDPKK